MGILGLLPLLKSIHRPCNLKKFSGLTIGVDAYGWLHRGAVASAVDLALGKPTSKFVEFAMHRVRMLIHFGVTPYLVFDGDYLPSKGATEDDRAKRREESTRIGLQLYRTGKAAQAQQELQKAVDVTPEMARQLIDELKRHNVDYVVAPYEADAQLAYLERIDIIQGIISEDSDLLVFGAKRLLTKLDQYGDCVEINRSDFTACRDISLVGWSDAEFRRMAILSGCDYLKNVERMGLKTSYRMVRQYKSIEKILQMMQFGHHRIPDGYLEDFRKAEQTFLHQRVFDPVQKIVIMATEPEIQSQLDGADYIGKPVEKDVAVLVANGTLNPMTKQPIIVDWAPVKNSMSPWLAGRRPAPSTPIDLKKPSKPIQSFFKPRRMPLAELDPNCFTPSPSQQRLQEQYDGTVLSTPLPASNTNNSSMISSRSAPVQTRLPSAVTPRTVSASRPPSKKQRLCGETEEATETSKRNADETSARSRFFSTKAAEPSPSVDRRSRKDQKDSSVNIWSDDAIEEIMAGLPDESGSFATGEAKVAIFCDSKTKPSATEPEISFSDESQPSTTIISTTTSQAHSSPSFSSSASSLQKDQTAERYCALKGESLQELVKTKNQTVEQYCALNHKNPRDILKKKENNHTVEQYCAASGKSLQDLVQNCSYNASRTEGVTKPGPVKVETSLASKIPLKLSMSQQQNKGGIQMTKSASLSRSQSLDSGLINSQVLKIAKSPDTKKTIENIGSEDFLVPNSEDEGEDTDQRNVESPQSRKIDLGRFFYAG